MTSGVRVAAGGPSAEDRAYHASRNATLGKQAQRRARDYGAVYEFVDVVTILDRDDWTCRICEGPIDPAGRWVPAVRGQASLNSWMPSLDHLVPLCRGGAHTAANVRASHLTCNAWRGEGPPDGGGPPRAPGPRTGWGSRSPSQCGVIGHCLGSGYCLCEYCLRHPLQPRSRDALYPSAPAAG